MIVGEDLIGRILHQDSNLIILDKPAGLAVHGGPRTPDHLEAMLDVLRFTLRQPPRPVHRLDRDTSGCLVLARHDKAASRMGRLFRSGKVEKVYWAVVAGDPPGAAGVIAAPLNKATTRQGWRMRIDPGGLAAITEWAVLGRSDGLVWLELRPRTGRTHQIRVHCADSLGCPVLGDALYGSGTDRPLHLHARQVAVPYWADRPPVTAVAPPPPHMQAALKDCGWR